MGCRSLRALRRNCGKSLLRLGLVSGDAFTKKSGMVLASFLPLAVLTVTTRYTCISRAFNLASLVSLDASNVRTSKDVGI